MYTPDSVGSSGQNVTPQKHDATAHHSKPCRHLSQRRRDTEVSLFGWQFVACQVLPGLTRTAATRSNQQLPKAATSQTHSPCSQLHARLAEIITDSAGRPLPHPFTPYLYIIHQQAWPAASSYMAGLLSVAVVVNAPLPVRSPHLLFHEATLLMLAVKPTQLEVGKFLYQFKIGSDDYTFSFRLLD
ncbi:MAG: hypothetical protein AAF702_32875 [Chloroflexota bacterium]